VILKFSKKGLKDLFEVASLKFEIEKKFQIIRNVFMLYRMNTSKLLILLSLLQGKIQHWPPNCQEDYLPEASRFAQLEELDWAFGTMGHKTKRNIWLLCISKTSPILSWNVWMITLVCRYAERLGRSVLLTNCIKAATRNNLYDDVLLSILKERIETIQPTVFLISIPFLVICTVPFDRTMDKKSTILKLK
jgi:hypothetical protein